MPTPSAIAPASQGRNAPPTTETPFSTPMAVGTSRGAVSVGTSAIAVGKSGPRRKPTRARPAPAAAPGSAHVSSDAAATPTRQKSISRSAVAPSRSARGLRTNRPTVSPSQ